MDKFGSFLKEARNNKHMTQKQLGSITGFSQNTISQHENGTRMLNERDIKIYANALNVGIKDLILKESSFVDDTTKNDITIDIELYEQLIKSKDEQIEQLLKELDIKNSQIEQLTKLIDPHQA